MGPLKVALLWHLHQPSYWDPQIGRYRYPWAFLHCARHYHAMAHWASLHPRMRVHFNLTPVLLEQIEHYAGDEIRDSLLEVVLRPAEDLSAEEAAHLQDHVFHLNAATMINPFPRDRELRKSLTDPEAAKRPARLKAREIRDLQALYLLTWCGSPAREEDPVRTLIAKERDYTEDDKALIFEVQRGLVRRTIPLFRRLQDEGIAELTTSPYFHPVLPLVIDCDAARQSRPEAVMNGLDFRFPADAQWQVAAAVEAHRGRFGSVPAGMWPAEGALSEEALALLAHNGIRWTATDEAILARSFPGDPGAGGKHRPWRTDDGVLIHFRDRELSDRIGFIYPAWNGVAAADDLVGRLLAIARDLGDAAGAHCVTLVLDGENPWEHYPDRGQSFLGRLYERLPGTPGLEPVLLRDHIEDAGAGRLSRLMPGSWIDGDFGTWIGSPEKNHAWMLLCAARKKAAAEAPGQELPVEFYRAQGSDWFWWLGPGHDTPYKQGFLDLFRKNLAEGLRRLGLEAPPLFHEDSPLLPSPVFQAPMHLFTPKIDGRLGTYYEWVGSGYHRASEGSYHWTGRCLERVRFGFDLEFLYLRLEGDLGALRSEPQSTVVIEFRKPRRLRFLLAGGRFCLAEGKTEMVSRGRGAFGVVVEVAVPLDEIGARAGDPVEFSVEVTDGRDAMDRLPRFGFVALQVPPADFGWENWSV